MTKKTYKYLKLSFNASDFMIYEKEYITERLTEWLYNRLKSIGNENGNENEDVIKDDIENGKKPKFDFKKSLISLNVDEDIASDWMVVRRQKKLLIPKRHLTQLKRKSNFPEFRQTNVSKRQ